MDYKINVKTYDEEFQVKYDTEKLGPLEEKLLESMDPRATDLVYLFLEEHTFAESGITTEEELLKYEIFCNSVDGNLISECAGIGENGIIINEEQVQKIFPSIWDVSLFSGSTAMDFMTLNFYRSLKDNIKDVDEFLFWTFRLCAWGGYDNRLPYTLYKGLMDGRFAKFYDNYPHERKDFIDA